MPNKNSENEKDFREALKEVKLKILEALKIKDSNPDDLGLD